MKPTNIQCQIDIWNRFSSTLSIFDTFNGLGTTFDLCSIFTLFVTFNHPGPHVYIMSIWVGTGLNDNSRLRYHGYRSKRLKKSA